MTWLYLALSVSWAWVAYNLYRPRYSGPYRAVLSFFAGWLGGELILIHISLQALVTFVFLWNGALYLWPGQLGFLITLASWAAMARHQREAAAAAPAVEAALSKALGSAYREEIAGQLGEGLDSPADLEMLFRPYRIRHPDIERIKDIRFSRAAGLNLSLDLYRHRSKQQSSPVLMQVHGGGWVVGSKEQQGLPLVNRMAARGWLCVNVNYRLSPHATFPDHLVDLKRAIQWLHEHAAEYGGDLGFIAVSGGSAGGHLAAMLALTANDPEYQPGFEEVDTSVSAAVPFYGVYDFRNRDGLWRNEGLAELLEKRVMKGSLEEIPEAYDRASPRSRVHAGAPPFMIVHGDRDSLAVVEEARAFASELAAVSKQPVVYAEIPGAQHAFDIFPSLRTHHVLGGVERFLSKCYSDYLEGRSQHY